MTAENQDPIYRIVAGGDGDGPCKVIDRHTGQKHFTGTHTACKRWIEERKEQEQ